MTINTVGVVTGAGSGMGLACATRMADMVDVLLMADMNEGALSAAAQQLAAADGRADIESSPSTSPMRAHC
jgi:NADP-dependent 3-hydroxy acid dehydrogenase YdfG